MIYRADYLNTIKPFYLKPIVKVLSGLRRVGKSFLLQQIQSELSALGVAPENQVVINKELLVFDHIANGKDLHSYVHARLDGTKGPRLIIVDEVQDIESWEGAVNSLLAEGFADIYLSGSNANLFSSELASKLTGRYVEIPVFPLGFQEFLLFREVENVPGARRSEELKTYQRFGGLPGIHNLPLTEDAALKYLGDVQNSILLKDVVRRHNIRDIALLERIFTFALVNCGKITTAKSISDYFKSQRIKRSVDTVQDYLSFLSDSFLIRMVKRYDLSGKRHMELYEKYYVSDLGLRSARLGRLNDDLSGPLENIVYCELIRRGFTVHIGMVDRLEIDFVAEKKNKRCYVQVALALTEPATIEREFGNLERIADNYPKYVISPDPNRPADRNGIIGMGLEEFLSGAEL